MGQSKYDNKKSEFVLLRANGLLLREIAEQLGISKRTIERWNKDAELQNEIKTIQAEKNAELQKVFNMNQEERLKNLSQTVKKIDEVLDEKTLRNASVTDLLKIKISCIKAIKDEETTF